MSKIPFSPEAEQLWIAVLYAFAFLIYPSQRALHWSFAYLFSIFGLGVYYYFSIVEYSTLGKDIIVLAQIYGSGLIYISLLYAIAKLKEKYIEAEIRSDMMSAIANTDMLTGALSRTRIRAIASKLEKSLLSSSSEVHRDEKHTPKQA